MLTLQEFDLRGRGSAQVVEEWQLPNSGIRGLWRIEDLVSIAADSASAAIEVYEQYCHEGVFPGVGAARAGESSIVYFIKVAEKVNAMARAVDELAAKHEVDGCAMHGLKNLQSNIARLSEVLTAAEWREIDLAAPSDDELRQYAENVRPPVDYYAE